MTNKKLDKEIDKLKKELMNLETKIVPLIKKKEKIVVKLLNIKESFDGRYKFTYTQIIDITGYTYNQLMDITNRHNIRRK